MISCDFHFKPKESKIMKILQLLKFYLRLLGYSNFDLNQLNWLNLPLNQIQCCLTFSALLFFFLPPTIYFCFEASNFSEFSEAFFFASAAFLLLTLYLVFFIDKTTIIQLINDLDKLIQSSNGIYFLFSFCLKSI